MIDTETGLPPNKKSKNVIYESFKSEDSFMLGLEKLSNKDKLGFFDSGKEKEILRFY